MREYSRDLSLGLFLRGEETGKMSHRQNSPQAVLVIHHGQPDSLLFKHPFQSRLDLSIGLHGGSGPVHDLSHLPSISGRKVFELNHALEAPLIINDQEDITLSFDHQP